MIRMALNAAGVYGTALALLAGVIWLDLLTGVEVSFSLVYLLPIVLVAWRRGGRAAVLFAGICAVAWTKVEMLNGRDYSHPVIPYWNAVARLVFFLLIGGLYQGMRQALERERGLARTDSLTGAVNRRHFFERLAGETDRARRYGRPFAVAYLDLDHFKKVNDMLGHQAGDDVLRAVVNVMADNLRRSDTVARLGGDEFALILPETEAQAAELVVVKLRYQLLDTMRARGWPITFSIGLLSCGDVVPDDQELIKRVDQLMYAVKRDGRDNVQFASAA